MVADGGVWLGHVVGTFHHLRPVKARVRDRRSVDRDVSRLLKMYLKASRV